MKPIVGFKYLKLVGVALIATCCASSCAARGYGRNPEDTTLNACANRDYRTFSIPVDTPQDGIQTGVSPFATQCPRLTAAMLAVWVPDIGKDAHIARSRRSSSMKEPPPTIDLDFATQVEQHQVCLRSVLCSCYEDHFECSSFRKSAAFDSAPDQYFYLSDGVNPGIAIGAVRALREGRVEYAENVQQQDDLAQETVSSVSLDEENSHLVLSTGGGVYGCAVEIDPASVGANTKLKILSVGCGGV